VQLVAVCSPAPAIPAKFPAQQAVAPLMPVAARLAKARLTSTLSLPLASLLVLVT
jgi:hypothetical protein